MMAIREKSIRDKHNVAAEWQPRRSSHVSSSDWQPRPQQPKVEQKGRFVPSAAIRHWDPLEPPNINEIVRAVLQSKWIVELEKDWDGEGSAGYANATWRRAIIFFVRNTSALWEYFGVSIAPPSIDPGPDGSIDLHWRSDKYELLVNIPAAPEAKATYYGETRNGRVIKGSLNIHSPNQWLLMWLTE